MTGEALARLGACLGLAQDALELVEYRPAWARAYAEEAQRILAACRPQVVAVEHVGSTAIPGLLAKPILDLMPGLVGWEEGEAIVGRMIALGYEYRGENGIPGRRYFVLRQGERTLVHAHAFAIGGENWRRQLAFRDYLRSHPREAARYAALKRRLAEQYSDDRAGYTGAKGAYVRRVEALASGDLDRYNTGPSLSREE